MEVADAAAEFGYEVGAGRIGGGHRGQDLANRVAVGATALTGSVEIDDVQGAGSLGQPALGHGPGVVAEYGLAVVVAL